MSDTPDLDRIENWTKGLGSYERDRILALVAGCRRQAAELGRCRAEIAMLNAEVDRLEARIESIVDRQK